MCNTPLIDVRPEDAFLRAHARDAANVPLEELASRVHELPARSQRLRVTDSDSARSQAARDFLAARGHPVQIEAFESVASVSGRSMVRLWQPSPFLVEALDFIEREDGTTVPRTALDVACGTGRDAAYMALRGLSVCAIDVLPDALIRAADLAKRSGAEIATIEHDLESGNALPQGVTAQVVAVFRYLHRPLFPALCGAARPGGFIVYETFHERNRETGQRPHSPDHLLQTGELPGHFSNFDVLIFRDGWEREGRYFSSLLARKPANVR